MRREISLPPMQNAQNILRPISFLYDRHISFFEKVYDDLDRSGIGCYLEKMDVNEMLRHVRRLWGYDVHLHSLEADGRIVRSYHLIGESLT